MLAPIISTMIFLAMFALIITEKFPRHIVTLSCGLLTLVIVFGLCMHSPGAIMEALSFRSMLLPTFWVQAGGATTSTGINWETIFFICGMMIMVEGMAASGFFRWLCMTLACLVHYRVVPIFLSFMVMAGILSMFIDSITVILFLAAVTVELAQLLHFNPTPMILAEIFCANLGGAATMCGDPPNIIIGTSLGYSFADFISNTGVMALLSALIVIPYFFFVFRKSLVPSQEIDPSNFPHPREAIVSRRAFFTNGVIFISAILLLMTHSHTRLTVSCIGTVIAVVTLIAAGRNALQLLRRVDWCTLLFFIGLFVVISGLEQTGVLELLADAIGRISGGKAWAMVSIIIWGSAFASAFIDNIPFAATMIPVIRSLAAAGGADLGVLSWALSMGTDIGGSATPIGASANVVGLSIAAKSGHHITWKHYCSAMTPITALVISFSMVFMLIRYF